MNAKQVMKDFAESSGLGRYEEFNGGRQMRVNFAQRPHYFVLDIWENYRRGTLSYHIVEGQSKGERGKLLNTDQLKALLQELATESHIGKPEPKIHTNYTVNTDASFSVKHKRAAYAYWIKGDDFHSKSSGMFPNEIANSALAELLAFSKAIERLNQHVHFKERKHTQVYVNTDSIWVINALTGKTKKSKNMALIKSVLHSASRYKLVPRHVKAHTKDLGEPRSFINDWCDKAAKGEMGKSLYA